MEASASDTTERYKKDVFLSHSSADDEDAKRIYKVLRQELDYTCAAMFDGETFDYGRPVFDDIAKLTKECKWVLVFLTPNSKDSPWVLLETLLALEESERRANGAILRFLCSGVTSKDCCLKNCHETLDKLCVDYTKDDWKEKLKTLFKETIIVRDALPVGNLAHGLVFSHFTGYLAHVLPQLKTLIEKSNIYKNERYRDRISKKYFMLLPSSCKIQHEVKCGRTETGVFIEVEQVLKFTADHMGKSREFCPTLFKMWKEGMENEVCYFFADWPNVLNAIYELQDLAPVNVGLQLNRFYLTYNRMVNHMLNAECNGSLVQIVYNDATEDYQDVLFDAVTQDIQGLNQSPEISPVDQPTNSVLNMAPPNQAASNPSNTGPVNQTSNTPLNTTPESEDPIEEVTSAVKDMSTTPKDAETHPKREAIRPKKVAKVDCQLAISAETAMETGPPEVVIFCYEENKDDRKLAENIREYLHNRGVNIAHSWSIIDPKTLDDIKWHVFIFSKAAIKSPQFCNMCCQTLTRSLDENQVKILPVLRDLPIEKVPRQIGWVTLIVAEEERCFKNLLQIIKGRPIKMEHRLPAGDVATGLAWAYFINYLKYTLKSADNMHLRGRIQQFLREKGVTCGCIRKFYIICPRSCVPKQRLEQEANVSDGHAKLEYLGDLEAVTHTTGGQHERTFKLMVFKYINRKTGKNICFITEYCTPLGHLHYMADKYPFAGLTLESMYRQGEEFVRMCENIMSRQMVKGKLGDFSRLVQFIYFNDVGEDSQSLMSALEENINFEEPDAEIVYKDEIQRHGDNINRLPSYAEREGLVYEDSLEPSVELPSEPPP